MKNMLIIAIILISCTITNSQKLSYWPEVGMNLCQFDKDDLKGSSYKISPNAGIGLQYHFSEMVSVKARFLYSRKYKYFETIETGRLDTAFIAELSNSDWIGSFDYDTSLFSFITDFVNLDYTNTTQYSAGLDYFEIPIYFSFTPHKNIEISAGFYAGFLMGAYTKEQIDQDIPVIDAISVINDIPFLPVLLKGMFSGYIGSNISNNNSTTYYNSIDYGISAGISYKTNAMHIDIYGNYGLNTVTDYFNDKGEEFDFIIGNNRHFYFQASIGFYLERIKISFMPSVTKI